MVGASLRLEFVLRREPRLGWILVLAQDPVHLAEHSCQNIVDFRQKNQQSVRVLLGQSLRTKIVQSSLGACCHPLCPYRTYRGNLACCAGMPVAPKCVS